MRTVQKCVFDVSKVAKNPIPLASQPPKEAVESLIGQEVEACHDYRGQWVKQEPINTLMATLDLAFSHHYPIVLSPDMIWLTLLQGFNIHCQLESKGNPIFSEEKTSIKVQGHDFVPGSPENPWARVFDQFAARIHEELGERVQWVTAPFSTTGKQERAAFYVSLMDLCQNDFDYEFETLCGIPKITLEGCLEDWQNLRQRIEHFTEHGLEWWLKHLRPCMDIFVMSLEQEPNPGIWQSLYKVRDESGGPYSTGWILNFFPYMRGRVHWNDEHRTLQRRKHWLSIEELKESLSVREVSTFQIWKRRLGLARKEDPKPNTWSESGSHLPSFPVSFSKAPVTWRYFDQELELQFIAGLLGIRQNIETLELRPEIGWAVPKVLMN